MKQLMTPKAKVSNFNVPIVDGGTFNMAEASPENFQIIVVYRGLHCPKCKTQLQAIESMVPDIRADGHDIIALSMDDEERATKARREWNLKELPVAHSLELLDARSLGLFISDSISEAEPRKFAEPGIFVVRPDGTLYAQMVQNTPFGRPDMADLLTGLNYAVENDYPTRGTSVA